ncbi:MAG: glutaredoxin family protein [Gaiellaceae bacterium]
MSPRRRSLGACIPETHAVRVSVYHAAGCHLCERALEKVRALREELRFELEEIPIDGEAELEARYRELIPVVEIDGERVFTHYVHDEAFRRRLALAQTRAEQSSL